MDGMKRGHKEFNFLKDLSEPHMFGQVLTRESLNDDMRVSKDIKVCDVHELGLR
jgi:hypothetical protein